MTSFLVVPQWQGSTSSRAMRLSDGAMTIAGDLPAAATRVVDVPLEAGDDLGSRVHRLSALAAVRHRARLLADSLDGPVVTIGGDCGVELALLADHRDAAVVWFDAHPDLNTPTSSPSGAFSGMVLRTLLGDGPPELVPSTPLTPDRVVLAGTRAVDPGEQEYIDAHRIRVVSADQLDGDALVGAVEATGRSSVYLHIDLDVLDPGELRGLADPQPFGVSSVRLLEAIRALRAAFPLAGAGLAAFAPASEEAAADDMAAILRIVGAIS